MAGSTESCLGTKSDTTQSGKPTLDIVVKGGLD